MQKGEIYECGFSGVEEPLRNIEVQYYVVAIFFIIYEIEFLLMLPFFVASDSASLLTLLIVIFSFMVILFSYWYEWDLQLLNFSY